MIKSRREVLAAMGAATVGGISGCAGVTEQSFEASPVVIPEADQEELVMAETTRDSETVTREGPSGNVEVSITNHAFACQRGPARGAPTVLEKFASNVNQTPGSGSAISVMGSNFVQDDSTFVQDDTSWWLEDTPTVDGDQFNLIIPEGARGGDTIDPGVTMTLVPGAALERETVTYDGDGPGAFFPSDIYFPSEIYFPSDIYSPESPSDFRVFVPNVDTLMNRVGMDTLPDTRIERVESGETIETAETVFAGPADVLFPSDIYDSLPVPIEDPSDKPGDNTAPEGMFDRGTHLPLGGEPFGLAALSTPAAEVAGQSANPLVDMGTEELLQQDAAHRMLARTGITDQDEMVEWVAGPQPVSEEKGYRDAANSDLTLLGEETEPETFVGVVSGENGPWGVLVNVARITDDDHVVAVSALSRPVGTEDGGMELMRSGQFMHGKLMQQAFEFSGETMGHLSRVDDV